MLWFLLCDFKKKIEIYDLIDNNSFYYICPLLDKIIGINIIKLRRWRSMKRMLGYSILVLCCTLMCKPFHCTHVHTEECGDNGKECTHECFIIQPRVDENPKY